MKYRKAGALIAGSLAIGLLAACSSGPAGSQVSAAPAGDPVSGGTLVFGDVQPVTNAQTQGAGNYSVANLLGSVLDRLTYLDPDTQTLVPWIASSFEQNDTATEFTFTIRDGVTFSDGTALDAAAVAANLDLLGLGSAEKKIIANPNFVGYDRAEVVDDSTVKVYFGTPNSNFLFATAGATAGLVSPGTLALDLDGQSDISQIVGSGPFVFDSQVPEQEITLVKRDDYAWPNEDSENQGAAYLDSVVIKVLAEVSLRAGAVTSGQVDVSRGIQPTDEQTLADAGFQVIATRTTDLTANFAAFRLTNPATEDVRVRQALQIGFDRDELVDTVLSDSYTPAASILPHGARGFTDLSDELAYDPDRAAALLDEAGWTLNADGLREKDGVPLEVALAASNQSVVFKPAFDFIAQQWRELGVVLENRAGDTTFMNAALVDDTTAFVGTRLFVYGGLGPIFSSDANVWTRASIESLNDQFAAENASVDAAEQDELRAAQQQQIVLDDAIALVLWDETQVQGASPSVNIEFSGGDAPLFQSAWVAE